MWGSGSVGRWSPSVEHRVSVAARPVIGLMLLIGFGAAAGLSHQPLLVAGALCGLAFMLLAITTPVAALALFFVLTFVSQLSVVGPGLAVAKGAGGALVLGWIYRAINRRKSLVLAPSFGLFLVASALFITWSFASALWAADPHAAISSAARIAQGPLLVIVIVSFIEQASDLRLVCHTFIVGATLSAIVGLSGVTKSDTVASTGRLSGGIGDPNYLAAVLVPAVTLSLFMFLGTQNRTKRVLLLFAASICLIALFLTESRGGIIALAVAVVASVAYGGAARRDVLATTLLVGAFASVYLLVIAPPQTLGRLTQFRSGGGTGRTDLWTVAAKAFDAHPIEGIGLGNFVVVEPNYAASVNQDLPRADLVVTERQPVHNTYLHIAAELGVIGAALLFALLGAVLAATRRGVTALAGRARLELELIGRGLFVGCVGMLTAFTFLTAQYEKQLWLTLGLLLAFAHVVRRESADLDAAPVE